MPLFYHKYVNYVLAHSVNYVITLYSLPLPLHRTSPSPQPSQSTSIVSPRTITLASLVKGEVLSPERIRATTGVIAFLPHPFRFSDTSVNNPSVTVTENTIHRQRWSPQLFIIHHSLYKKSAVFSDNGL